MRHSVQAAFYRLPDYYSETVFIPIRKNKLTRRRAENSTARRANAVRLFFLHRYQTASAALANPRDNMAIQWYPGHMHKAK